MNRYFVIYKPYKMLSQFVSPHKKKRLLSALEFDFPEGTHAVGRLDDNSEGLLLLTTDKSLTGRLLHPSLGHRRTYLVQVEKIVSPESLEKLRRGVDILTRTEGRYTTLPCDVEIVEKPHDLPPRGHAFREDLPQTWLKLTLTEGKFHQVRKMCSAIGHDCKRLIRLAIADLELNGWQSGEVREYNEKELFDKLFPGDKIQ